jgi:hypothetical protein
MTNLLTVLHACVVISMLQGCAAKSHDRPQDNGASRANAHSSNHDELYPTKLENCVTAVGADRTQCAAKEK